MKDATLTTQRSEIVNSMTLGPSPAWLIARTDRSDRGDVTEVRRAARGLCLWIVSKRVAQRAHGPIVAG